MSMAVRRNGRPRKASARVPAGRPDGRRPPYEAGSMLRRSTPPLVYVASAPRGRLARLHRPLCHPGRALPLKDAFTGMRIAQLRPCVRRWRRALSFGRCRIFASHSRSHKASRTTLPPAHGSARRLAIATVPTQHSAGAARAKRRRGYSRLAFEPFALSARTPVRPGPGLPPRSRGAQPGTRIASSTGMSRAVAPLARDDDGGPVPVVGTAL